MSTGRTAEFISECMIDAAKEISSCFPSVNQVTQLLPRQPGRYLTVQQAENYNDKALAVNRLLAISKKFVTKNVKRCEKFKVFKS